MYTVNLFSNIFLPSLKIFKRVLNVSILLLVLIMGLMPAVSAAPITKIVDVATVDWLGSEKPSTTSDEILNTLRNQVAQRWLSLTASRPIKSDFLVKIETGLVLRSSITLSRKFSCDDYDFLNSVQLIQREAYSRLLLTNTQNRVLVILIPDAGCLWLGKATIGSINSTNSSVIVLHDNSKPFVIAHELGHSLGLGHSNLLRCSSGAKDGPWSSDCRGIEYGGVIDIMGNVDIDSGLSTFNLWRLGLLPEEQVDYAFNSGTFKLYASDINLGRRAVFLREFGSSYWIEFRRSRIGSQIKPGLSIYRLDPPPANLVLSPIPLLQETNYGKVLTGDFWVLNLDDFVYSQAGSFSGSPTLGFGKSITLSGGTKITVSEDVTDEFIILSIDRLLDKKSPRTPQLVAQEYWNNPTFEIVENLEDEQTGIIGFELEVNGIRQRAEGSKSNRSTYLDPMGKERTLRAVDLPEGSYSLRVRSLDYFENRSDWSNSIMVNLDTRPPEMENSVNIVGVSKDSIDLKFSGIKDSGSKICSSQITTSEGFVVASSKDEASPVFRFLTSDLQFGKRLISYDCSGNYREARVRLNISTKSAVELKRTGKWSKAEIDGVPVLWCAGRCSASLVSNGNASWITSGGNVSYKVNGIKVSPSFESAKHFFDIAKFEFSEKSRLVRLEGSRFYLYGVSKVSLDLNVLKVVEGEKQRSRIRLQSNGDGLIHSLGFNSADFAEYIPVNLISDGDKLSQPTLDICKSQYESDLYRKVRKQVAANLPNPDYLFVSSEVVVYKDSNSSKLALRELRLTLDKCREQGGWVENGVFNPHDVIKILPYEIPFSPNIQGVQIQVRIGNGVTGIELLAFMTYKEETYVGIYLVKRASKPFTQEEIEEWNFVSQVVGRKFANVSANLIES